MAVTTDTIRRAKLLEGLPGGKPALKPYRDIAGIWTNGYGNTRNVDPQLVITEQRAHDDLVDHLCDADAVINRHVTAPLNDNQRAALQLFVLNVGEAKFSTSTLVRLLNQRRYDVVPAQLMRWTKYRNPRTQQMEDSPGLVNRRAQEVALWSTPTQAQLTEAAALQGNPLVPAPAPNPTTVTKPAEPPQPTSVLQTSTGKATATAIGTGIAGVVANAKPIADAAVAAGGINALNLLYVLGVLFVAGCIAASVWLLWDRSRKVREEGR